MTDETRPVVRCIIAKPVHGGSGHIERSRLVPLSTALLAMRAGFVVVGPDPDDLADLAAWERAQRPFNQARRVW